MNDRTPSGLSDAVRRYRRFSQFMLHRFVALWFMVIGGLGTLMALIWVLLGQPIVMNGTPTYSVGARILYVLVFLIPTVVGWLLWRSKPVDPDDSWIRRGFDKMVQLAERLGKP